MLRSTLRLVPVLTLCLVLPSPLSAQDKHASRVIEEVRATIRQYNEALRRADTVAVPRFWATELTFINPPGELLTRDDRIANLRSGRTAFDSLAPVLAEERIRIYGPNDAVAVHTTLLIIGGRYSGRPERGQFRGTVVLVRRDGRWQQVSNQLTPVTAP